MSSKLSSVAALYSTLDALSPFSMQESWDNSGIICQPSERYTQIFVSIDVDDALIERLPEYALLITHHPLIFSPLRSLQYTQYPDALLLKMADKKITNIAMHTNFDKTHLNRYVASEVLACDVTTEEEFLLHCSQAIEFDTLVERVKKAMQLSHVKVVKAKQILGSFSLCTGAGASFIDALQTDCLITGDVKYHDAMRALSLGKSVIDVGHFESEHYFAPAMADLLQKKGLEAIITNSKNPFMYS